MHRKLLILLLLCLCIAARGQAVFEYRYWFDGDESTMHTGTSTDDAWQMDFDIGSLDASFHIVHFQVKNVKGVWSVPMTRYFMKLAQRGQTNIEYWFDNDTQKKQQLVSGGKAEIDVSKLDEGMHIIHIQASASGSTYSSAQTAVFWKQAVVADTKYRLWFDNKPETMTTGRYTGHSVMVDVSTLDDGFHILHAQVENVTPSKPHTSMFIKVPQTQGVDYLTCALMVDGEMYKHEQVPARGGVVNWNLDAVDMAPGLHKAQAFVVTPSGAATGLKETFFYRVMTDQERSNMKCMYSIDGSEHYTEAGTLSGNLFHFNLDLAGLDDGFHQLSYMLVGEDGTSSKVMSSYFYKTPLGGNGIMQYEYWLNDKESDRVVVRLDERTSPLKIVKLLQLNPQPLRSCNFHFEAKNGTPVMYAQNELHFAFYDVSSKRLDETRQFVDYNVSQPVEAIETLQNTQTFKRLDENEVKWFKLDVEKGDSVSFKCSQATSIQLFASSGEQLYNASGSESVQYGGIHVNKSETYYLAIHDITGTKNENLTLDYLHINKFDLFGTSSATLGVMPCVQMLEIDGNGFDNLKSASLVMGNNNIKVDSIACNEKSKARLYMMFRGKETFGKYDLVLNFDDGETSETLIRNASVELEAPRFDDIDVVITDPRIVADPYPVTIKLTNKSNISYQAIPFFFGVDHIDQMTSVKFMDFAVGCNKELYDKGVMMSYDYDSFRGNNSKTRIVPALIPEMLPGETKTFTLGIKTGNHQTYNAYAWIETPWNLKGPEASEFIDEYLSQGNVTFKAARAQKPAVAGIFDGCADDPCDLASHAGLAENCICGIALSLGGTLGGIQNALQNQHNQAMREQLAMSGLFDDPDEFFPNQYLPSPADLSWYALQHCLPDGLGDLVSALNGQRQNINNPDCQDPNPHQCNQYNPGDPNEIHGYTSDAGSKFISDSVREVSYSIEFENDPKIANASAHKIVVTNELDKNVFDLSSFMPTKIQIGDKTLELDGKKNFTHTIDMRPEINAIAQVDLDYNETEGVATWTISSLDPMTMEETFDIMQGVLPVNSNGNGIGFLSYSIGIRKQMDDGDAFSNSASITFDFEEPIETPVWTNTVDAVAPESKITFAANTANDITLRFDANDNRSGVWKYNLYVQEVKDGKWTKVEDEITTSEYTFKGIEGFDYGFCVMAVDSAGNVEQKELAREISISTFKAGDANSDGIVDAEDASLATNYYLGRKVYLNFAATDINKDEIIDSQDVAQIQKVFLSTKARSRVKNRKRIK